MYGDALRGTSPWFPAGVLSGPKLRIPPSLPIPARQYLLFRGPLEEICHWGARELTTGSPKDDELPAPHLLWPRDHRWFVATDVDSDFIWAGGSEELIDAVIRDPNSRRSASTASERPSAHDAVSTRGAGPNVRCDANLCYRADSGIMPVIKDQITALRRHNA